MRPSERVEQLKKEAAKKAKADKRKRERDAAAVRPVVVITNEDGGQFA